MSSPTARARKQLRAAGRVSWPSSAGPLRENFAFAEPNAPAASPVSVGQTSQRAGVMGRSQQASLAEWFFPSWPDPVPRTLQAHSQLVSTSPTTKASPARTGEKTTIDGTLDASTTFDENGDAHVEMHDSGP
jgi:hypothetical protein